MLRGNRIAATHGLCRAHTFVRFREQHWTDEDFRALQQFLLLTPTAGDVIRGTHGLRKFEMDRPWARQARWCPSDLLLAGRQESRLLDLRIP